MNLETLPPIIIQPGIWENVAIKQEGHVYYLEHNNKTWHRFNTKNFREVYEQWSGYDLAYGDVLISGFGFGHFALWLANKPEVKSVTVIEFSQNVIEAFLANNSLPENVTIIINDMNKYKTDKHYDCIILDHISNNLKSKDFYKKLLEPLKNISHDLAWFWSIELFYLHYFYEIRMVHLYVNPIDFKPFDFSTKWQDLLVFLEMSTIPSLSKEKLDSYINAYFLRHLIQ